MKDGDILWEPAVDCAVEEPQLVSNFYPPWYKCLSGNLRDYQDTDFGPNHTARHCLGLRGLSDIGYTVPVPADIVWDEFTAMSRGGVTPQQLHGTKWAEKDENGEEKWVLRIITLPWRAKLKKNWRLLITPYMLDWSDNYFCFSGAVEANYQFDNNTIGGHYIWDQYLDHKYYNYFNLEMVVAIRKGATIKKDSLLFTAIPLYDKNHSKNRYSYS
jgi:hypothetical protein